MVVQQLGVSQKPVDRLRDTENRSSILDLINSRELLLTWARREFRVRYSQSVMGAAWAIFQPLVLMIIFTLVFSYILPTDTGSIPYPVFSYTGTLTWTLFANSLTFAIPSLVANMNLVSKIYFPREILPIASVLVGLVDFVIASLLFIPLLIAYQVPVGPAILFVPLIVLVQTAFTIALSLFASAVNVFFRDVRFVVPLGLQIWLYLSPVIYPLERVPESLRPIYMLNPMATLIDSYRRAILFNQMPNWPYFALTTLVSLVALILAYRYFKRMEREFADVI